MNRNLVKTGVTVSIVAAICCFTPALVILSGVFGLSAFVGYIDIVLLPALGVFLLLIVAGIVTKDKGAT